MERWFVLVSILATGCGDDDGVRKLPDAPEAPAVWLATTELPVARTHAIAAVPGNGYVYIVNGYVDNAACNAGRADGRVWFAPQNADGTLGAWTETTVGPAGFVRAIPGGATANGYIYVAGGAKNAPSWDGVVWFAKPAADGTIATWTQATNAIPGGDVIGSAPIVAIEGTNLYAGGGFYLSGGAQSSTNFYRAAVDAGTGQPGAWTQLEDFPTTVTNGQLVFSATHAYLFPGGDQVFIAPLGANGPAGWQASTSVIPVAPQFLNAQRIGDRLFVIPGQTPTNTAPADLYASTIQADGSIGAWSVYNQAPVALSLGYQAVYGNGYYYALGYDECFSSADAVAAMRAKASYFLPLQ